MILLIAVLVSIGVAFIRGGRFGSLSRTALRFGWLALLAFTVQAFEIYAPLLSSTGLFGSRTLILMGTYVLLVAVVLANYRTAGITLIGIGLVLNLVVMLANGGFMPIAPEALKAAGLPQLALGAEAGARVLNAKDILLPASQTRLWILSDIMVIPPPFKSVFSVGDVSIALGAFVYFQKAMLAGRHRNDGVGPALDRPSVLGG